MARIIDLCRPLKTRGGGGGSKLTLNGLGGRIRPDSIGELVVLQASGERLQIGKKTPPLNSEIFQPLPNYRLQAGGDQKLPKVQIFIVKALNCLLA